MTRPLIKRYRGLQGPAALLAALITQATNDALGADDGQHLTDAWSYFGGPAYVNHLTWLGLPPNLQPELFESMEIDDFVNVCSQVRCSNNVIGEGAN